ncbi:MAG TPA: DUF1343 domain-containing protein [Desulfobacterales bacterium]|nr:DUF1343 domain-containing protein [Desulfobacterales bacterium]
MVTVRTGLEVFCDNPPAWVFKNRIGILCNPASVSCNLCHARELINRILPGQVKALYSPQHGFFGEKQDNMIESSDITDPILGVPVFSLYGQNRIPTQEMFDPIDVLIVDLQDVGTRVYTFIYTMSYCLEAAKRFDKKVLVFDRPNPITGSIMEGNCLSPEYRSFVGRYPIPMRHGMTIGELSILFNDFYGIGCNLKVIPMKEWKRDMYFKDTGLPWIPPSPNLPTPVSAMVYPGQVMWEGTNISEGRGTTQPFETFGAPFIDIEKIMEFAGNREFMGAILRRHAFEPTSGKWKNTLCRGFQIHITDPYLYKPYISTLKLLQAVRLHHEDEFEWKLPPYEYEFDRLPIDLILGDPAIRQRIENQDPIKRIEESWQPDLEAFKNISRSYYLYR